jgi:hypothetical protein
MSLNDNFLPVIDKVDLLLAELEALRTKGPHFRIVHRFRAPGSDCLAGEEIAAVYLVHRGREHHVRLSLALRILFDFLARHPHLPQSASQIEAGVRGSSFYSKHAANAPSRVRMTRRLTRSAVKEYIVRVRQALQASFRDAGLRVNPREVLVSQPTAGNEISYRLRGTIDWIHIDGEI